MSISFGMVSLTPSGSVIWLGCRIGSVSATDSTQGVSTVWVGIVTSGGCVMVVFPALFWSLTFCWVFVPPSLLLLLNLVRVFGSPAFELLELVPFLDFHLSLQSFDLLNQCWECGLHVLLIHSLVDGTHFTKSTKATRAQSDNVVLLGGFSIMMIFTAVSPFYWFAQELTYNLGQKGLRILKPGLFCALHPEYRTLLAIPLPPYNQC